MNSLVIFMCLSLRAVSSERFPPKVLSKKIAHISHNFQQGHVTTIAGRSGVVGFADGNGQNAIFNNLRAVCFSKFHDCLFACDDTNHRIRRIDLKTGISACFEYFFTLEHRKCAIYWKWKPGD